MHVETLDPENHEVCITIPTDSTSYYNRIANDTQTGDFKESMNITEFHDKKAQQPLPPSLSPHQADIYHFETLCRKTCNRILTLLALGLEVFSLSLPPSTQNERRKCGVSWLIKAQCIDPTQLLHLPPRPHPRFLR